MKENCKKKLFISGPITDTPFYWRDFEEARDFYEAEGYAVMNPAELPVGMSNADYARICLSMIDSADEVAFLPGWHESVGAKLEHDYCYYIRKPVRLYSDDLDRSERNRKIDETAASGRTTGAIDITPLIERILNGEKDDADGFVDVMDFAVGQALDSGYSIDFSQDKEGWRNVTLRAPIPREAFKKPQEEETVREAAE